MSSAFILYSYLAFILIILFSQSSKPFFSRTEDCSKLEHALI
jgi:hypothetical protein